MLISEQKYTNKNRLYYRGLKKNGQKNFQEIYLTTKFNYALSYARYDGKVEIYRLKETANIFNVLCKEDEGNLRKILQKKYPKYLKYIDILKHKDWARILGNERQVLISIIRYDLKYDGYFNFEIDEEYIKDNPRLTKEDINSPAIAIFEPLKSLKKIDVLEGKRLLERARELKKIEKNEVYEKAYRIKEQTFKILREESLSLTDKEIYNAIKASLRDKDKIEKRRKEYERILEDRYAD